MSSALANMDTVEFIRTGGGTNERAKILINGLELVRRWEQGEGRGYAIPLWTNEVGDRLERWGPLGASSCHLGHRVPEGYAPVLTRTCGEFGCGGAIVRIRFQRRVVTWDDFKTANHEKPVALGKFTFGLTQYEEARNAF